MPGRTRAVGARVREWRSTRLGALLWGPDDGQEGFETIAERFPPAVRWRLLASLAGVTVVAIAVRAPLLGTAHTAPDTSQYLDVARQVFHGGFPDNLRPPGYASLLAIFEAVGANPVTAIVVFQNLIGMILPAAVLFAGWRFFNPATGLVAGFLTAASPLMIITEQLALADYIFGVALFAGTILLAEAALRIRGGRVAWPLLVATGATFGFATLFRANGLLALAAMPVALLAGARAWRPALRASGFAIGAMILVLAPWSLHNLIRFGDPNIASEGGVSLYARVITWDAVPPPASSADGRLALSIYNTSEPGEPGAPRSGLPTTALFNALVAEGRTPSEASSVMGGLAQEALLEHPGIYLENTWNILDDYRNLYDPHAFGAEPNNDHIAATRHYFQYLELPEGRTLSAQELESKSLPGDSSLTRVPWQLAQAVTRLLFLVTIGGLLVLLLPFLTAARQRLPGGVVLGVLLLGVVGGSLTAVFSQRYDVMFAPFVWLLMAATAARIVEVLVAAVGRRRVAPAGD
jgi:4-amino-4-deoxy-L-arabinose transferase-like glycosyltransferase